MPGSKGSSAYELLPINTPKLRYALKEHHSHLLTGEENGDPQGNFGHQLRHWRWETFTFTLGTGAFASILALLLQFRDKPPPDLPFGNERIQLTAIIAALAQVAQSALLVPISYCIGQLKWEWFQHNKQIIDLDRFDLASRGPDGSVRLLIYFSWRQRLASLGALATILMLLFPTFVQQSVQVGEKETVTFNSELAVMPRTINVFQDPKRIAKLSTLISNGTISSYEIDTYLSSALRSGATGYSMNRLVLGGSDSGVIGRCYGSQTTECSWPSFNSLALCYSTNNVSQDIIRKGGFVTLPALQDFLPSGKEPPSFQSGSRLYIAGDRSAVTPLRATSISDGTNLPNLAEIYYLYYDVCVDPKSDFDKSSLKRWVAFKGQFQFCIQKYEAQTFESGFGQSKILESTTSLEWYRTTKYNDSAFCTKVESETEDFCIAESIMEGLSVQMSSIFNTTAFFSDMSRSDIRYSTEWGPRLARAVFGEESDTAPSCAVKKIKTRGWQISNPYVFVGEYGFGSILAGIAHSLSDAFRDDFDQKQDVYGTAKTQKNVLLVEFRWVILPAVLYGIVTVFFAATVFRTRNTPIWKSSPLPLLYAAKEEGGVGSANTVKKEVKGNRMVLRRAALGWQLTESTVRSSAPQE